MRTFVHFDAAGAIQSLITVDAPEGVSGGLVPGPGLVVDEVQGVDLKLDETDVEAAREIAKTYKVEPSPSSPRRLVER